MTTTQWEYQIKEELTLPIYGEVKLLNNVGLDGWELCGVIDGWDKQTKIYYFKRIINYHVDVLNEDETQEKENQYPEKRENKKYLGYQPNGIKLDDSNPPTGGSGVRSLPPTPKRPPIKTQHYCFHFEK